jgi:hypothetical protein
MCLIMSDRTRDSAQRGAANRLKCPKLFVCTHFSLDLGWKCGVLDSPHVRVRVPLVLSGPTCQRHKEAIPQPAPSLPLHSSSPLAPAIPITAAATAGSHRLPSSPLAASSHLRSASPPCGPAGHRVHHLPWVPQVSARS